MKLCASVSPFYNLSLVNSVKYSNAGVSRGDSSVLLIQHISEDMINTSRVQFEEEAPLV